jgi:hypothetical protein
MYQHRQCFVIVCRPSLSVFDNLIDQWTLSFEPQWVLDVVGGNSKETIGERWERWDERLDAGAGKVECKNDGNRHKENAGSLDNGGMTLIHGTGR